MPNDQITSLGLDYPFYVKILGRVVEIDGTHDFVMWLRIRDKRIKKFRSNKILIKKYAYRLDSGKIVSHTITYHSTLFQILPNVIRYDGIRLNIKNHRKEK